MSKAYLVAGLGFGDEGKGATVDYLTWKKRAELVVRYNGGSQAAHNVVMPDGRWHTFQQFGSGMFHADVRTHLSRFMLINPMNMMREEEHLREIGITDAWARTTVDPRALIITPFHRQLNRLTVPSGTTSCGHGVGFCRAFHLSHGDKALFAGDLLNETKVREKLMFIQQWAKDHTPYPRAISVDIDLVCHWYKSWSDLGIICGPGFLEHCIRRHRVETIIFEGAQGVLLDETHGEEGFNTWTDTTLNNAKTLLDESGFTGERIRVGVIRTYYTRHGAGPFPTEDQNLYYEEPHNEDSSYQGEFRRGLFDKNLFAKAIGILGGIDMLALNHLDHRLVKLGELGTPKILGMGPTYEQREELT